MLDIQLLRKDLPAAIAGLKRRGFDFDEAGFRALEDERKRLHDDCATEAVYRDPSRLKEIGRRIAELETELIAAYAEWEDFAERL